MDLVKPWLGKVLLNELRQVLEWRAEGDNLQLSGGKVGCLNFEDDGSRLAIQPAKVGQIVQVLKFQEITEPVKVAISDSRIRMTATFSSASTQEYKRKNQREVYEGTLGGVFQLLEYEIRATSFGPKSSQLSLYIIKFKNLGAAGSGVFGQIPRSIEVDYDNEAPALLAKVAAQRRKRDSSDSQGPSTRQVSPRSNNIQSPASDLGPPVNDQSQTDSGFATQLPRAQSTLPSIKPPAKAGNNGLGTSILKLKTSYSEAANTLHTKISKPSTNAELLSFIANLPTKHSVPISLPSLQPSSIKLTSPVIDQCDRPQGATINNTKSDARGAAEALTEDRRIEPAQEILSFQAQPLGQIAPEGASVKKPNHAADSMDIRGAKDLRVETTIPPSSKIQRLNYKTVFPRSRRNGKISMRDIKISKDQAELLSRPDSWLPPEPGQREPIANVPVSILNTLNAKADRRASHTALSSAVQNDEPKLPVSASIKCSPTQANSPDSDPDQSIPWSSSPSHPPPDSPPVSQNGQQASRPSSPSSAHSPTPSSKSPINKPIDGRVNGNTDDHFSMQPAGKDCGQQSVSSIHISISEDETLHSYRCRASSCTEVYRDVSALRQHLEQSHRGKEHDENELNGAGHPIRATLVKPADLGTSISPNLGSTAGLFADGNILDGSSVGDARENLEGLSGEIISPNTKYGFPPTESSFHSQCSSDPELEVVIPRALDDIQIRKVEDTSLVEPPSTAVYAQVPFTQVKRTPYANGQANSAKINGDCQGSSLDHNEESRVSGTSLESSEYTGLSGSSAPHVSTSAWHVNATSTADELGVVTMDIDGRPSAVNDCTDDHSDTQAPGGHGSKKREFLPEAEFSKPVKRPKLSDFFPDSTTQEEESPSKLRDRADQHRRDFFTSRRSSATSLLGSNTVSPNKLQANESPISLSKIHQTISRGSPLRSKHDASLGNVNTGIVDDANSPFTSSLMTPTNYSPRPLTKDSTARSSISAIDSDAVDVQAGAKISGSPMSIQVDSLPNNHNDDAALEEQGEAGNGSTTTTNNACHIKNETSLMLESEPSNTSKDAGEGPPMPPSVASQPASRRHHHLSLNASPSRSTQLIPSEGAEQAIKPTSTSATIETMAAESEVHNSAAKSKGASPALLLQVDLESESKQLSVHKDKKPRFKTLFDRFKAAYPCYLGNPKHFKSLCMRIRRLVEDGGCLQQFLWDDFIIRQKTEYSTYLQQCAEDAEDPLTYERYYTAIPDGPLYTKKIVTAQTLSEVVDSPKNGAANAQEVVMNKPGDALQQHNNDPRKTAEVLTSQNVQLSNSPPKPKIDVLTTGNGDEGPVTIDLTLDEQPFVSPKALESGENMEPGDSASKPHRSLPWPAKHDSPKGPSLSATYDVIKTTATNNATPTRRKAMNESDLASKKVKAQVQSQHNAIDSSHRKQKSTSQTQAEKWYQDENTPFNTFVRNYNAIRPGKGNSFANPIDLERMKEGQRRRSSYRDQQNLFDWIIP